MKNPTVELDPSALERTHRDGMVSVTMTIPADDVPKLHAWMSADTYEQAQAIRAADLAQCLNSLEFCVNAVLTRPSGGTARIAAFLASLYNGTRVKVDLSGIGALDPEHFAHVMNVMRLCFETSREPHSFFKKGNDIFERIIADYGLEKRRRKVF